ncbi:MAG: hypothetical protein U1F57_01080 [bacterium]
MPDSLTCSQPVSSSQNYTPASQEPNNTPGQICGTPRSAVVHDDQIGLCYSVTVPCGSNQNLETERFRDRIQNQNQADRARSLANAVAVRLQNPYSASAPRPAAPAPAEEHGFAYHAVEFLLGLTPLGWSGCAVTPAEPDVRPEIPDGSNPPPNFDPVCDGRRSTISSSDPLAGARGNRPAGDGGAIDAGMATGGVLAELNRQYSGITLPTLNVTYNGTPIWNDSLGRPVTTITTSDPVSFTQIGNKLFVLTANSVSGGYAPATLLVYDASTTPPTPMPTDDAARDSRGGPSNAIVLGFYNPAAMASMVGNSELDILFGAPNAGVVSTIDPFTMRIVESDWCSTHSSQSDGGTDGSSDAAVRIDGGVDASRDSGSDSRDSGVDASSDSRDAASDTGDARGDAGVDGSRG